MEQLHEHEVMTKKTEVDQAMIENEEEKKPSVQSVIGLDGLDASSGDVCIRLVRYRDAYQKLQAELAEFRDQTRELDRMKREIIQLKALAVGKDITDAAEGTLTLREIIARRDEDVVTLRARIAEIESSTSWRLTSPIRKIGTWARRLYGKGQRA